MRGGRIVTSATVAVIDAVVSHYQLTAPQHLWRASGYASEIIVHARGVRARGLKHGVDGVLIGAAAEASPTLVDPGSSQIRFDGRVLHHRALVVNDCPKIREEPAELYSAELARMPIHDVGHDGICGIHLPPPPGGRHD